MVSHRLSENSQSYLGQLERLLCVTFFWLLALVKKIYTWDTELGTMTRQSPQETAAKQ